MSAGDDPLADETLSSELAWKGEFLTIYRDRVRSPDGHVGVREYIKHPGAVLVVPLAADDQVVLERQYRYPLRRSFIEFPAGKLDPGEPPRRCAERELLEETGFKAARWDHLGQFHNAVGYTDETIDVFLARDLVHVGTAGEAGEVLQVFTWPRTELLARVRKGEITDGKTLIACAWLERFLDDEAHPQAT